MTDLAGTLVRLDGRAYAAYRDLAQRPFDVGGCRLVLEHVQGDPFAPPSRVRVDVPADAVGLPPEAFATADQRRASADFLHRRLVAALPARSVARGRDAGLGVAPLGQEVLARTAVRVDAHGNVVARLTVTLPAAGRRILGRTAEDLLARRLPSIVEAALGAQQRDPAALRTHVYAVEDQVALRAALPAAGLVGFLAEGAMLARRSGADDRPHPSGVPLESPPSFAAALKAPHAGRVRGLGVPTGVTLIVGGGYHGKSTLLAALSRGVFDHVPGDGRERCVTRGDAIGIRAEDGRSVRGVDLRPFIGTLPGGRTPERFDTDDASGSTSQAAAIVEALEAGACVLLIDEDTAATNFMIRDARMRRLVAPADEPITPFLDRVRQLADDRGVSSVLVVGGAGDYLDVADSVIQLQAYRPRDVTSRARAVAESLPLGDAAPRAPGPWPPTAPRIPDPASLDAHRGPRTHVRSHGTHTIAFGDEPIDVSLIPQLTDPAQVRYVGDALLYCARTLADGQRDVPALLDALDRIGFDAIAAPTFGDRAAARRFEVAAVLNRLRSMRLR